MMGQLTLSGGDYAWIVGLTAMLLSVPTTLMVYNLKSLSARITGVEKRFARRMDIVEGQVRDNAEAKVGYKQFVHVIVRQENRQQTMAESLAGLEAKLDATIGIAANLARIGTALERQGGAHG